MSTTTSNGATKNSASPARAGASSGGLSAQLAYLTRVLKVPTVAACWDQLAEQARDQNWSHEEYLAALLARQVADREAAGTDDARRSSSEVLDHLPRWGERSGVRGGVVKLAEGG